MGIRSTCAHSTGLYPSLMQQDFVLSCRICAAMVLHVSYPLTPCTGYQIQDIANSDKPLIRSRNDDFGTSSISTRSGDVRASHRCARAALTGRGIAANRDPDGLDHLAGTVLISSSLKLNRKAFIPGYCSAGV